MLVWIDTETTGLDFSNDKLLEVAVIITTDNLKVVDRYTSVIKTTKKALRGMDEWCQTTHGASGLLDELATADKSLKQVEQEVIALLDKHDLTSRATLAGNSVHFDRRMLETRMPRLMARFTHQNLDVSAIGLTVKRWTPNVYDYVKKIMKLSRTDAVQHRALSDLLDCIESLRLYKKHTFTTASEEYLIAIGEGGQ